MAGDPTGRDFDARRGSQRRLIGALLSAVVPGLGQLWLGKRRSGTVLLVVLCVGLIGFWPLRLPSTFVGLQVLGLMWVALFISATTHALTMKVSPLPRPSPWWLWLLLPVALFSAHLIGNAAFRAAGFRVFGVPAEGMAPMIQRGDRLVADMRYYKHRHPERGDVAVIRRPDSFVVKRVVAIGGDTIEGRKRQIWLNGNLLQETYAHHISPPENTWKMDNFGRVSLPADGYFVMGDNRDLSFDSRMPDFQVVATDSIAGKALYIVRSRSDRGGTILY